MKNQGIAAPFLFLASSLAVSTCAFAAQPIVSDTFPDVAKVVLNERYETYSVTVVRQRGSEDWEFLVGVQAVATHAVGHGPGPDTRHVEFVPARGTLHRSGPQVIWTVDDRDIVVASRRGRASDWELNPEVRLQISIQHIRFGAYWVSMKLQAGG